MPTNAFPFAPVEYRIVRGNPDHPKEREQIRDKGQGDEDREEILRIFAHGRCWPESRRVDP